MMKRAKNPAVEVNLPKLKKTTMRMRNKPRLS
jgi:hypothetical protein